jgi:hypothetical protein
VPDDVLAALDRFPHAHRAEARALVESIAGTIEGARVVRCVLHLAKSNLAELARYAAAAQLDHRDVIWWAEYDGGEHQLRDFTKPLPR